MGDGATVEEDGDIDSGCLPAYSLEVRETAHDAEHLVLIQNDAAGGELLVVSAASVGVEGGVEQTGDILGDEVIFRVSDAEVLASEAGGVLIDHGGDAEVVSHPAVFQEAFEVGWLHHEFAEHGEDLQPAGEIIGGIPDAAPLSSLLRFALGVEAS